MPCCIRCEPAGLFIDRFTTDTNAKFVKRYYQNGLIFKPTAKTSTPKNTGVSYVTRTSKQNIIWTNILKHISMNETCLNVQRRSANIHTPKKLHWRNTSKPSTLVWRSTSVMCVRKHLHINIHSLNMLLHIDLGMWNQSNLVKHRKNALKNNHLVKRIQLFTK